MARYIDADAYEERLADKNIYFPSLYRNELRNMPTADVAPKSEVDRLEYTLLGVMHSVDKWLDGDELKQDEVNRAATMREKTLRIIENAKTEVAREIFAEIEEGLQYEIDLEDKNGRNAWDEGDTIGFHIHDYAEDKLDTFKIALSLLKKKYTEEKE